VSSSAAASAENILLPKVQFSPAAGVVYAIATARSEAITGIGSGQVDALIQSLEELAQQRCCVGEIGVAGTAWGLAFMLGSMPVESASELTADRWQRFRDSGGNVLYTLGDDMAAIASIFSKYPNAVKCLASWKDEADMLPTLLACAISEGLSMAGDAVPAKLFVQSLGNIGNLSQLIEALHKLSECTHSHSSRGARLGHIVEALQHTTRVEAFSKLQAVLTSWTAVGISPTTSAITQAAPMEGAVAGLEHRPPAATARSAHAQVAASTDMSTLPRAQIPDTRATGVASMTPSSTTESPVMPVISWESSTVGRSQRGPPRKCLECDVNTFADLRSRWPPVDPASSHKEYLSRTSAPQSAGTVDTFLLLPPEGCSPRESRWHFWLAMADIGIFVKELFLGTPHVSDANSTAGLGAKGQHVVYAGPNLGTVLLMERTGRLFSPNATEELKRRLRIRFPPFISTVNGAEACHGRWPATATSPQPPASGAPRFNFNTFQ